MASAGSQYALFQVVESLPQAAATALAPDQTFSDLVAYVDESSVPCNAMLLQFQKLGFTGDSVVAMKAECEAP